MAGVGWGVGEEEGQVERYREREGEREMIVGYVSLHECMCRCYKNAYYK